VDFYQNKSENSFSLGATVGVRSAWWLSPHLAVWFGVRGSYFPRSDVLFGEPSGSEAELPHLVGTLSVGVALGQSPRPL
jgi:hypothetical protein